MAKLDLNEDKTVKPTNLLADRVAALYNQWNPEPAQIPEKDAAPKEEPTVTSPFDNLPRITDMAKEVYAPEPVEPGASDPRNQPGYWPTNSQPKETTTTTTSGGSGSTGINKDVVSDGTPSGGGDDSSSVEKDVESVSVADNVINSILNNTYNQNASDVYDKFMEIMGEEITMGDVMSEGEANARARDNYNGAYNKEMEETMRTLDKNALRSGFYGQLPTEQLKANAAAEIEASKQAAINQYASDLVSDSRDAAQVDYNNALNERNQRANLLSTAVNSYVNLDNNALNRLNTVNNIENDKRTQDREDEKFDLDKSLSEAELTGLYNGMPTMEKQALDADISQGWTKIANDKAAQDKANVSSESEYQSRLYSEAYEAALDFMTGMYDKEMLSEALNGEEGSMSEQIRNEFYGMIKRYIEDATGFSTGYSSAYEDGWLNE